MTTRRAWKKVEQRVAERFGAKRNPLSGSNSRHTSSDTLSDKLYIEVKSRKKYPQPKLWNDTVEKAKKENKTPLVVFHKKNFDSDKDLVLCRIKDLKKIAGELEDD